jgi:hypothetical protein
MEAARRSWVASWVFFAWLLTGWLLVLIVRHAAYPHGTWDWVSLVLLWFLSIGLVAWMGLRLVLYLGLKRTMRRGGAPLLTVQFVRNFLLVGWVLALVFRLGALFEVPNLVSGIPLWAFSTALVAFSIWRRARRRRGPAIDR